MDNPFLQAQEAFAKFGKAFPRVFKRRPPKKKRNWQRPRRAYMTRRLRGAPVRVSAKKGGAGYTKRRISKRNGKYSSS